MNKVGIAFSTKDRTEFTAQTLPRILDEAEGNFDFFWLDGSATREGQNFINEFIFKWRNEHNGKNPITRVFTNVTGGSANAIITGWQLLYNGGFNLGNSQDEHYDYIGIIENDVLLTPGWFKRCMELFGMGERKPDTIDDRGNLYRYIPHSVGAVSSRCFTDRILEKRDGYAVMANVGAGMFITRRDLIPILLEDWRQPMLWELQEFCEHFTGMEYPLPKGVKDQDPNAEKSWRLSHDWFFEISLWRKGYQTLACVPSMAVNLDDPEGLRDPVEGITNAKI